MLSEYGCPTGTPFGLIAPTEVLQERRCLGILHRLVLCSGVLSGTDLYPSILLLPNFFSGILHGSHLCPRIMDGPDVSVPLHGPESCSRIFRDLCRGNLNGLYGPDLRLRTFLRRPSWQFR